MRSSGGDVLRSDFPLQVLVHFSSGVWTEDNNVDRRAPKWQLHRGLESVQGGRRLGCQPARLTHRLPQEQALEEQTSGRGTKKGE